MSARAPAVAEWLFDRNADPFLPIILAVGLFALTIVANLGFRWSERRFPEPVH
jgi:hypothetical protein